MYKYVQKHLMYWNIFINMKYLVRITQTFMKDLSIP